MTFSSFLPQILLAAILAVIVNVCNGEIVELAPQEFYAMHLAGAFAAVVDVRTQEEWETGHIFNATLLDSLQNANTPDEIASIADLGGCENCPLVVYCRTGRRSGIALEKLALAGFANLYNGMGVSQWTDAGYDLVNSTSVEVECKREVEEEPACPKSANTADDPKVPIVTQESTSETSTTTADGETSSTSTAAEIVDATSDSASISSGSLASLFTMVGILQLVQL